MVLRIIPCARDCHLDACTPPQPGAKALQANTVEQLRTVLMEKAADYLLLSSLPSSCAHVKFIGRFEDQEVLWDMHLYTLERYAQASDSAKMQISPDSRGLMQIATEETQVFQLSVALRVPVIDAPTIQKTILMMRNYRKLAIGVHIWGDAL